ncbi:MAG: FtsX-like permease family protein [Thermoguttaceae bacterium]
MKVAWKLALAYVVQHPTRTLLTCSAMIASVCIVVWVASSYDALASQFGQQATEYLGRYDFFVVPEDPENPTIASELTTTLRRDPAVAEVEPVSQSQVRLMNPNAEPEMDPMAGGMGGSMRGPTQRPPRDPAQTAAVEKTDSPRPKREAGPGGPPSKGNGADRPRRPGPSGPGGPGGMPRMRPMSPPTLVGTDAKDPPYELLEGVWLDHQHPEHRGAVLTKATAESLKAKLGDPLLLIIGMKEFRIHVAGVIGQGATQTGMMGMGRGMRRPSSTKPRTGVEAGPASSAIYLPRALADQFSRGKSRTNLVNIRLKPEAKSQIADFRKRWEPQLATSKPMASMLGLEDIKTEISEGMVARQSRQQAWAATGLSLLAALFIIFTTLSMGVTERVRQFAVMRAVGLTRGQVSQAIAVEGLLLALIGWLGGLAAGRAILAMVAHFRPELFRNGPTLGTWCIALTALSAFGGALAASIVPAWRANSVEPLEAMSPPRSPRPGSRRAIALAILGLPLIAINPILVYATSASMSSDTLYYVYMAVGCTSMAIGFLLLTPIAILAVERFVGPWLARLLGIEPRLLRSQLGSNLWRTLGTTAALTVGLGLYVSIQIWGYSMLEPFKPGRWVPDMLVCFPRGGLPDSEIDAVRHVEGVRSETCIPLAVEQPKLASDITRSEQFNSVTRQNNVIMIGLDPQVAFGGSDPLIQADFVEGRASEAIAKLKQGRNCIVPDHFLRAAGLKLGDHFTMVLPDRPDRKVEYTIVGAVSLPGWHWMTKFSGLRRREGRSAAMVFADYATVRRDFELHQINFFWMSVDENYGRKHLDRAEQIAAELKAATEAHRMPGGPAPADTDGPMDGRKAAMLLAGEALRPIADRNQGEKQPVNAQGTWAAGAQMFGESVRVSTPDEVLVRIVARAGDWIWGMSYLPLVTLLATSLGVVNTVMASVRARRWEFGVLRAIGVTRSGLVRMVVGEGILIGLITCLLSLAFGITAGWCGTGISQYVSFFGGLAPPLIVPWSHLFIGLGMALGLCLFAALWPAVLTGRTEPLKLLQAGRASM